MAPLSLREFCTSVNRRDDITDELQLHFFSEPGGSSASLEGRLASTGERFVHVDVCVVGLDRLRELSREKGGERASRPRALPAEAMGGAGRASTASISSAYRLVMGRVALMVLNTRLAG